MSFLFHTLLILLESQKRAKKKKNKRESRTLIENAPFILYSISNLISSAGLAAHKRSSLARPSFTHRLYRARKLRAHWQCFLHRVQLIVADTSRILNDISRYFTKSSISSYLSGLSVLPVTEGRPCRTKHVLRRKALLILTAGNYGLYMEVNATADGARPFSVKLPRQASVWISESTRNSSLTALPRHSISKCLRIFNMLDQERDTSPIYFRSLVSPRSGENGVRRELMTL